MNITVKKWEVLYFFKVKSLDGSLKKTIHLFQQFLKIFLIQACTIKLKKANLLKGKDAKPWIYGQMSMIARLPIFVLFHNSTLARSWLVYFFAEKKVKEVGVCQRKAFCFFWDLSLPCWRDAEQQAVLYRTPCRRGAGLKNQLNMWTWIPFVFVRLL